MYTKFFGLKEKPFSITPDPHFLFLSDRHAEALAHLVFGVTESGGFIQLTGEVGTGKTTLTRCLLERLPQTVDLAVVLNPRLTVHEFLITIFDELHLDTPHRDATTKELVDALNIRLLESHGRGRRTVLLVDEAQNLDSEVLEQLRLLTNLETSKEKLLQIILVGQPELRDTLARNDLRQLAQRITGRYHLENLTGRETIAYIKHRMKVAGGSNEVFESAALWEAHRLSQGIPRLINVICDRALLGAYAAESGKVTRRIVRAAAAEVHGTYGKQRTQDTHTWKNVALAAGLLLATGIIGWGAAGVLNRSRSDSPVVSVTGAPAATGVSGDATGALPSTPAVTDQPPGLVLTRALTRSPHPATTATDTRSLTVLLDNPMINTSTDQAFADLFRLWGRPALFDREAPCVWATTQRLKCEYLVGSSRLIKAINRPAILSLVDDQGQIHNAVVTRIEPDSVTLLIDGQYHQVGSKDIDKHWYGEFLVLWQPQEGVDKLLLPNTRSDEIIWLRQALAKVNNRYIADLTSRYYDNDLEAAVLQFQRDHQLEADGIAGVQTLIALNTALGFPGTPLIDSIGHQ